MAGARSIPLTELEAWAIEDMIRHTWTDEGRPVARGLLLKIFTLIREFDARRNDANAPGELPVVLTEDEFWAIDFHIRRGHVDPTGVRVGRELLVKIFARLLDIRTGDDMRRLKFVESDASENPEHLQRLRDLREQFRRSEEIGDDGAGA
ncbi:MAG: hypothetical protein EPO26_08150 [Chloroflexota bacterium]|nr:MAG: hypothetical protein EPO26_08150 [Chloroflexota bacterium]